MTPRERNKHNKGYPTGWRFRYNAWYYMVPKRERHLWDNKIEFKLGRTLSEAYKVWAERWEHAALDLHDHQIDRVIDLAKRYQREHLPKTSHSNQEQANIAIRRLLPVFGDMKPDAIQPVHAYRYFDLQSKNSTPHSAKADVGVLRHMLSMAVRWGYIPSNPILGNVRIEVKSTRDRYLENWEVVAALNVDTTSRGPQVIVPYLKLKLMTGLRRSDILRLTADNMTDEGLRVLIHKTKDTTGKVLLFESTPRLVEVINEIKRIPPRRIGNARLFVTREGKPYIDDQGKARAFNSIWRRFVERCIAETDITEWFQEKDFRAKVGSDLPSTEQARDHLGHASATTTERHYRRAVTRVTPVEIAD